MITWAEEATPLRTISKKKREEKKAAGTYVVPQPKNLLQRLGYLYKKRVEEEFFSDPGLNELFMHFYEDIRDAPYISKKDSPLAREEAQLGYIKEIKTLRKIADLFAKNHKKNTN